ncbi:MAG: hypothetical protein L0211_27115 [Planctomycetaceae bacterium]|nr:hypothetical protein [Planctomycetaceae bacterium]
MTQITLTSEQESILAKSTEPVAICRSDGSVAGFVSAKGRIFTPEQCPFTPEEIALAEREAERSKRWSTTKEVFDRLRGQEKS